MDICDSKTVNSNLMHQIKRNIGRMANRNVNALGVKNNSSRKF